MVLINKSHLCFRFNFPKAVVCFCFFFDTKTKENNLGEDVMNIQSSDSCTIAIKSEWL